MTQAQIVVDAQNEFSAEGKRPVPNYRSAPWLGDPFMLLVILATNKSSSIRLWIPPPPTPPRCSSAGDGSTRCGLLGVFAFALLLFALAG